MDPLVKKVAPVYPQSAKRARVQGTVRFEVVVGTTGNVLSARLVTGHPMLVRAATDAVKQWKYKPATLGGIPVEVITPANVNFTLDDRDLPRR
jgi:TonB family protein